MRAEDGEAIAQAANEVLPVATDAWLVGSLVAIVVGVQGGWAMAEKQTEMNNNF